MRERTRSDGETKMVNIGNEWDNLLADQFRSEYYRKLRAFLVDEYNRYNVYPPADCIFNALKYILITSRNGRGAGDCEFRLDFKFMPAGSQQMQERRYLGSSLLKKSNKYRQLKQHRDACYQKNCQCIDQPFCNNRSERLGKRNIIIFGQHAATAHFPDPGNYQTRGIRYENSIHTITPFRESFQRLQHLLPPPAAKHLCEHPE